MFNVYTTASCAYCQMVKKMLTMKNKEYKEIDITNNKNLREKALSISGMTSVPVVTKIINGEEKLVSVGWNPKLLMEAM